MKTIVLCKSYLMGTICPLVIYLAAGAYDIITQEDNSALNVMVIEGLLLLALPVFFLNMEKKLGSQCPTKWIPPMYLIAYGVITLVMLIVLSSLDMTKLFGHQFLGGIGLMFMWFVMVGGCIWAILFRIGALIVRAVKNQS
ncbi:hypothetical protein [Ruminococcus flavefaciens]|uniref:hypothetical protein n=1 Tax=Ruminococcus flavefaciens TaxID=1265 RepID=UPI0013DA17B1|nr:hypothetical protein [Ruminococcus flavefaciens]